MTDVAASAGGDLGFWALAQTDPERVAVVSPDGTALTAGELLGRTNQLVHALRDLGVRPGDTVATVLPNSVEMLEVYLACLEAGWYVVPINHHLVAAEIAYIVADSSAKVLVAHERFADACAAAAGEADVPAPGRLAVGAVPVLLLRTARRGPPPVGPPGAGTPGDRLQYPSGTTGRPKGIQRPLPDVPPERAALGLGALLLLFGLAPRDDNVHLVTSPLYHAAPIRFCGAALHLGHTVVLMDKWLPEATLELVERHRVTSTHMVPTQFHRLLALPEDVRHRYDLSSLRHVLHAAAPCPVEIKRRMIEWWGPVIDEYYAASEGGGTLVMAEDWLRKPGTVGRAWPLSEVAIFDDVGNRIEEPGVVGTVYLSTQGAGFEYRHDPEKTAANRVDGFFTVGDVGYLDEDGYLFLRDRKIDMIISGGANIYPTEIEAALLEHPAVGDVAVFGIPDEDWGEQVKAVVEPVPGAVAGPALAEELLDFCGNRLARFKVPRSIDFVDELPRDPNGKLYKRRLRDPYWAGLERSI